MSTAVLATAVPYSGKANRVSRKGQCSIFFLNFFLMFEVVVPRLVPTRLETWPTLSTPSVTRGGDLLKAVKVRCSLHTITLPVLTTRLSPVAAVPSWYRPLSSVFAAHFIALFQSSAQDESGGCGRH